MNITGVRFRKSYQVQYVDTNNLFIRRNSSCIVETEHGTDIGIVTRNYSRPDGDRIEVKGRLIRKTRVEDLEKIPDIEQIEQKAFATCRDNARSKGLEMKLVSVKCLFDRTKIIFYFVADNRIDFRELVRDLASVFRTRIEMRQIGVRDEARLIGGIGPCGRELCCVRLKDEFDPVSIKMAKEQSLNLNSLKISGMCGRLLCCLAYEYDVYRELNREIPKIGSEIDIEGVIYVIDSANSLKRLLKIRNDKNFLEISSNDLVRRGDRYAVKEDAIARIKAYLEYDEQEEQ